MARSKSTRRKSRPRDDQDLRAVAEAFRVPKGKKKLFIVELAVEVGSALELNEIIQGVEHAVCPFEGAQAHQCARRFGLVTHPASKREIASWAMVLNHG